MTCQLVFCRLLGIALPLLLAACTSAAPKVEQTAQSPLPQGEATSRGATHGWPPGSTGARTTPVVPGRPGRVFVFAGVDEACRSLPAPELKITRAPAKGEVTFKPGQPTTIALSAGGTCKDVAVTGTGVYYTARAGTSGDDAFAVSARLAGGETMMRDFEVKIAE